MIKFDLSLCCFSKMEVLLKNIQTESYANDPLYKMIKSEKQK